MTSLTVALAQRRAAGAKLLIAYLMAEATDDWLEAARALADAGIDALEVGVAFSDPMIDGPVIQEAARRALGRGATLHRACDALATASLGVPTIVMTYANVLARPGPARSARLLSDAGVAGTIVPDLPLEALEDWRAVAVPHGIETVLLAAPSSTPDRLAAIGARSEGFVYAVGRMATTGERVTLDPAGPALVGALREHTELPVCIGIGISTPEHAALACATADGVVVGSAIVRRLLDGASPAQVGAFAASLRAAIR